LGFKNKGLTATMYSKKAILGQPVKTRPSLFLFFQNFIL